MVKAMDELRKLYIEPTSACNLQCPMCFRHTWFDEQICDMPYEVYEQVMEGLPLSVETIFFGGMGEPLHHPRLTDMMKVAKEKGLRVEVLTNGSLLTDKMAKTLLSLDLDRLWVSMDTIEPSNLDGLGHPMYDRTIERLKTFNRLRHKERSATQLGITFVATKDNVAQLASLPLFIDRYHVSEVNISHMVPSQVDAQASSLYQKSLNMGIGSETIGQKRPVVNLPYMDFDLPEVREGLGGLFAKMNFNLQVGGVPVPRRTQHCPFIEGGMSFVRSDGEVCPCMALLHNGTSALDQTERKVYHHSFGNVMDTTLDQIWHSKAYSDFRQKVREFAFSPCMTCGHCDHVESNQEDCFGNSGPTCGACLWAEGFMSCP